jgi:EmrB/QacA subfamily drug resistance transporter
MSLFITSLDNTILNVALPSIERQFHAGVTDLQWIVDAYLVVLASLLMLAGSLGDRLGRRRVFTIGLLLFSAGSLLCSLAPSAGTLIAFRMVQAVGGSMLAPVSLSIVRQVYTDPTERARALGFWNAVFGLGIATGPVLGGLLVTGIGWRSVFWVNVPVGLGTWWLARRHLPESRAASARLFDPSGQILVLVLLGSLTYGIIEGPSAGWASPSILALFALAGAAAVALVTVESRVPEPLVELRFFRSPPFSTASLVAVGSFLILAGFLFVNTLYLQQVRGDSAMVAGLSLLPATVAIAACAPLAGDLVARFGPRVPMLAAGLCLAAGAAMLLDLQPSTPYSLLVASYILLGLGFGLINPPITNTAVSGMPPDQAGVASAIASMSRQVGNVMGVAIMGSLVTGRAFGNGQLSAQSADRFTALTHHAWEVAIACGIACALAAVLAVGRRGMRVAASVYQDVPELATGQRGSGAGSAPPRGLGPRLEEVPRLVAETLGTEPVGLDAREPIGDAEDDA